MTLVGEGKVIAEATAQEGEPGVTMTLAEFIVWRGNEERRILDELEAQIIASLELLRGARIH